METNAMSKDERFMNQGALATESTENMRIEKNRAPAENTENKRIKLLVDTDDSTGEGSKDRAEL